MFNLTFRRRKVSTEFQKSRSIDTHFLSSIYKALLKGEEVEFRPKIRQGVGIVYDLFGIEVSIDKLKNFYDRGLIEVAGEISFPSCPICGDTCLHLFLACPECGSRNIEKKDLLVHYDCGYMDSVEAFQTSREGVYRCPKCGGELKRVGIDYGRPGFGFICKDCRTVFQIPLVEVECERNHKIRVQQLEVKKFPVYRLSEESKKISRIFEIVEIIAVKLKERGIDAVTFAHVRGLSGVSYTIPIYVKGNPSLIIEIAPEEIMDERYPLLMTIEAVDVPDSIMIIILPSSFRPELESIFNPEKIKIIKVENIYRSVDEIVEVIGRRIYAET